MTKATSSQLLLSSLLVMLVVAPAQAQPASVSENQATITQLGQNQNAAIEQHNIEGGLLSGAITQLGDRNTASMLLEGGDLTGGILQNGNDNDATLIIQGRNNTGSVEQHGNDNIGGLQITGEGKDVALTQHNGAHGTIRVGGDAPAGTAGRMITIQQY